MRTLAASSVFWFALSLVNDGVVNLALPARLAATTGSVDPARLGWLTLAVLLAAAAAQLVAGSASDRWQDTWGRRPLFVSAALVGLIALLWFGVAPDPTTIGLAFGATVLAMSVAQAPYQALIADLVRPGRRGAASGLKGLADLLGSTTAFLAIGFLLSKADLAGAAMPVLSLGILACLVIAALGAPWHRRPAALPPTSTTRLRLSAALSAGPFRTLVVSRFVFLLGTYAIGRMLFVLGASRLGLAEDKAVGAVGLLLTGLALATALASPLAGWLVDRRGRRDLMLGGALLSAVGALALAVPASAFLLGGGALMAAGSAAFAVANWAALSDVVEGPNAASLLSVVNVATVGASAFAGLAGPLVGWGNSQGPNVGFVLLAGASCLAFVVSAAPFRRPFPTAAINPETAALR